MPIIPPYLKPGDTIGITCPAGHICRPDIEPAVEALERWGYQVKIGKTVGEEDHKFAGTDEERAQDFQQMLDDEEVNAILFGRGGYGSVRIIDRINFNQFYLRPKWLHGYSDITVIHSHIQAQLHIPTMHGEMCIDLKYGTTDASAKTIRQALQGVPLHYKIGDHSLNRRGHGEGILVGGNLSLLTSLIGSDSDIDTHGKILFIEDVHSYPYQIDGMMYSLKRAGKLNFLRGLIVGGFTHIKTDPDDIPFGKTPYEIVADIVKEFDYPVCFGFPAGHEFNNFTIKLGLPYHFQVKRRQVVLKEAEIER